MIQFLALRAILHAIATFSFIRLKSRFDLRGFLATTPNFKFASSPPNEREREREREQARFKVHLFNSTQLSSHINQDTVAAAPAAARGKFLTE
jgi:hypothetical protein